MPRSACPIVPSDSGWPRWPIITTSRPAFSIFATSTCTLVTSGQVASNTFSPRASASRCTAFDTPCAEKMTVLAGRHLVELLDEHRALLAQVVDDELVVHDLVAHVDRRAVALERALDDVDRAFDAGAEAAGVGEEDVHVDQRAGDSTHSSRSPAARFPRRPSQISSAAPTVIAESATLNAGKCQPPA